MRDEKLQMLFENLGVLMAGAIYEGIEEHEARKHVAPQLSPGDHGEDGQGVGSVARDEIPLTELERMLRIADKLQTRSFAIMLLARIFDYPEEVVLRDIEAYESRSAEAPHRAAG